MRGAGGVDIAIAGRANDSVATPMDDGLQQHLAAAAQRHAPDEWMFMPSGAAHDAQILASCLPAAMLFIPSIGGISHDFAEDSSHQDIVLGCQVLTTAVASILRA